MPLIKQHKPVRIKICKDPKRSWGCIQQTRDRRIARKVKYSIG